MSKIEFGLNLKLSKIEFGLNLKFSQIEFGLNLKLSKIEFGLNIKLSKTRIWIQPISTKQTTENISFQAKKGYKQFKIEILVG